MNIRELLIRIGIITGDTDRQLDRTDGRINRLKNSVGSLNGALALLGGAATLKALIGIGDEMQSLQARIGNATGDMAGAAAQFDELSKHADDGRVPIATYAGSWAQMMSGVKQFGGTADDTTKFMDTLSAAFVSNGTATQTAEGALFQLSQTMQGGIVQGEEMNSLIDAQGDLFHDIALEIGGTVANYKKMQAAGSVTSEMLLKAVNKFYDKYTGQLNSMPMTVQQALTKVNNHWRMSILHMNQASGAISKIANMIIKYSDIGAAAISKLNDALGGTSAVVEDLKWQLGGFIAIFTGMKLISLLTNPFFYMVIAIVAVIAVVQDLVAWINGDTQTAFGEMFGSFDQYKGKVDEMKAAWVEFKGEFAQIVKLTREFIDLMTAFENSAFSKGFGKVMRVVQNPFESSDDPNWGKGTGWENSPVKRGLNGITSWINEKTGNKAGDATRVPDLFAPFVNEKLKPSDLPSRGATQINNSGNVTNEIHVTVDGTASPNEIGKAVADALPYSSGPAGGGFNPLSLLNNAGAK